MKKWTSVAVALMLASAMLLTGCVGTSAKAEKVLYIYNWTEYIPQEVYDLFEKETGIHVVESTFSSNEEMLAKLQASGTNQYDIIVASNYVIKLMEKKNYLQKLDKSKIPNFKNLSPSVLGKDYDPANDYTIPYMATMTVLAVNKQKLKDLGVTITSFNDLLDPRLKDNIVAVDDARELVDMALKTAGENPDSTDKDTIEGTLDWLRKFDANVKAYDSDSPKTLLASNEVAVGLVYNLDAGLAIEQNDQIGVVYTKEPCELTTDNFVITATSKHKDNAEAFINFIHQPDVYKMCLTAFPGVCLNDAAKALLDATYLNNPGSNVDPAEMARAHITEDVGDAATWYDDVYTKMKTD